MYKLQFFQDTYTVIGEATPLLEKVNKFLTAIRLRGLSVQSIRSYGYDLVIILRWIKFANKDFENFTDEDLLDFMAFLTKNNAKPRSINRRLSTLECFYRFCFNKRISKAGMVSYPTPYYRGAGMDKYLGLFKLQKPFHLRLRVKVPKTIVHSLDTTDVNKFMKEVTRYRDLAVLLTMLLCGLRANEVLSLRTDQLDLIRLQLRIIGKGNKERLLPLPEHLISAINKYLTFERPKCETQELYVVLQGPHRGEPMTKAGLRSLFRHRRLKLEMPQAHPHAWRHTFATDMARSGVQLPVLQKMLGHADFQSTLQYINLNMADIVEEYKKAMNRLKNRYEYT